MVKAKTTTKTKQKAKTPKPTQQAPQVVQELEKLLGIRSEKLVVLQSKYDDLKIGMEELINLDSQIFRQIAQATQKPK
jgi:hypothetical protein